MPEVRFTLRWPDGEETTCYSPSTIIGRYLSPGTTVTVEELLSRATAGFEHASRRVEERFGFRCTSASDQLDVIRGHASRFDAAQLVKVATLEGRE